MVALQDIILSFTCRFKSLISQNSILITILYSSRLRALSELEGQMQAQHSELQNLRELQDEKGGGENLFQELETQWKETQRAFSDR